MERETKMRNKMEEMEPTTRKTDQQTMEMMKMQRETLKR